MESDSGKHGVHSSISIRRRKFFGEAVVVTQEVEDIISSTIVKGQYHQQLRLQDTPWPEEVHEQGAEVIARIDGKGEVVDFSINQSNDPSRL